MRLVKLNDEQKRRCELHLCFWHKLAKELGRPVYTEEFVSQMLTYEILTRRRVDTMDRLHARLTRLRRAREWREIRARTNNRGASCKTSP